MLSFWNQAGTQKRPPFRKTAGQLKTARKLLEPMLTEGAEKIAETTLRTGGKLSFVCYRGVTTRLS